MSSINFSDEAQINKPNRRNMFAVDRIDWERIKKMIRGIDVSSSVWEKAAWFTLSTTVSLGILILKVEEDIKNIIIISCIFSSIITLILFIASYILNKHKKNSKDDVIEEMVIMEKKISTDKESVNRLEILSGVYGTPEKQIDITDLLKKKVIDEKLKIKVSNEIGGDPDYGKQKKLTIKYKYRGEEIEKSFIENEEMEIP